MKKFRIKIDPKALADIQDITDWYNQKQEMLGKRFQDTTIKQINKIAMNPHSFAIRYNEIRCMLIKKFPYMVHFYINEKMGFVEILAVISTQRNPKIWEDKTLR
jgi:plasmid stabilization system protein ParE